MVPGRPSSGPPRPGSTCTRRPPTSLQIACDETTTDAQLRAVASALADRPAELAAAAPDALPPGLIRTSQFLTHPAFHTYRNETAMLRYLRRLADRDLALDRSMIPLGSCTMKLNAAAEMEPITWPEFANLHPFAPAGQAQGYLELIAGLEQALAEITGYDAVTVQPNAGSQGELTGLLAIRGYHLAQGEPDRDVCLIPESAHGTNAASAVLAGLRVVVVKCGSDGAIDLGDLHAQARDPRRVNRGDHDHLPVHERGVRGDRGRRLRHRSTPRAARCTWTAPT